jgi:hypothetical protein
MTGARRAHRKMLMLGLLYMSICKKGVMQQEAYVSMAGGRGIARRRQQQHVSMVGMKCKECGGSAICEHD